MATTGPVDDWSWHFDASADHDEASREALCTLGNGYIGTRGAAPEAGANAVHYPGTYAAGCYNRLTDIVAGAPVENESMVNLPNWLPFSFRVDDGPWLGSAGTTVLHDEYELDLRNGLLIRRFTVSDDAGRRTSVRQQRFVHLRRRHVCGLRTTITALNWAGIVTVQSGVDGRVRNDGVARYRGLNNVHLDRMSLDDLDDVVRCVAETTQSRIRIAVATRTVLADATWIPSTTAGVARCDERVVHELRFPLDTGQHVDIDKLATVVTARDVALSEPGADGVATLRSLPGFDTLLSEHATAWRQLWSRFHLVLGVEAHGALRPVRLHLFHLLQTISVHSADTDSGVPARGLHGEAYRGHILWDDLFVLPTLSLRHPLLTRSMLCYRHRRLVAACRAAAAAGHAGAMFPWQSGSDGREESQRLHLNPASGRWVTDETFRQRHVGLAVAYNVWQYCQATADWQFLDDYGAEMILQIARFFAGLAELDAQRGRYVIRGVVGPDEFHSRYPGAAVGGIDNNAYTNVMVVWLLQRVPDTLAALSAGRREELLTVLNINSAELARWDEISRRMFVPFHADGVISQFDGYESLGELDWAAYRSRYGDIGRLDRILEAEGDDVNRYRAAKQADVLMLFYLLSADELREVLAHCGYPLGSDTIARTVEFYRHRTSHGSTLSSVVHAWVLARSRRRDALRYFVRALETDIADVQGGTTGEGIHLGAMAGTIDLMQRCFGGVETRGESLYLNPYWPPELGSIEFDLYYRGHRLRLTIVENSVRIVCPPSDRRPITVCCRDQVVLLRPGDVIELSGDSGSSDEPTQRESAEQLLRG